MIAADMSMSPCVCDTSGERLGSAKVKADQTWAKSVRNFPPPAPMTVTVVPRDGGVAQTVTIKVKS